MLASLEESEDLTIPDVDGRWTTAPQLPLLMVHVLSFSVVLSTSCFSYT